MLGPASLPLTGCVGRAPPTPTELETPLLAHFSGLFGGCLPCGWAACCTPSCGVATAKAVEGGRGGASLAVPDFGYLCDVRFENAHCGACSLALHELLRPSWVPAWPFGALASHGQPTHPYQNNFPQEKMKFTKEVRNWRPILGTQTCLFLASWGVAMRQCPAPVLWEFSREGEHIVYEAQHPGRCNPGFGMPIVDLMGQKSCLPNGAAP